MEDHIPQGPDWYQQEAIGAWRLRRARWPDFKEVLRTPFGECGMTRQEYRSAAASALGLDATISVPDAAVQCRMAANGSVDCSYSDLAKIARYMRAVLASWDDTGDDFDGRVYDLVLLAQAAALGTLSDAGHTHLFTSLLEESCRT